jgi:glucosamine-6-phosphate deaminase
MTIPMSPHELLQKRYAIFKHQSQKDPPPFPGADPREFWQRAEDRNRATAALLDRLGLPEYEAVEAFVRYDIDKPNDIPL